MNDKKKTVLLAAGGTGGHLFPAFALAEELARRDFYVDLVTDERGDRYGTGFPARDVYQIPSATLASKSPAAIVRTAMTLSRGTVAAWRLLGKLKPAAVVGFGGYPTFPPLLGASMRKIPCALHEQNAVLGRANKMLARRVDKVATSFEHTKFLDGALALKSVCTGNPVRQVVLDQTQRPYWAPRSDDPISLVVFGGSQGARFFSDMVPEAILALSSDLRERLIIVQQARDEDVGRVEQAYGAAGVRSQIAPFFKNLPEIIGGAHLVIGRAGASTVAELAAIGRPSILVPLPHALDNDQLQNASRLAESGGAWCIEQKDLTSERLAGELSQLFACPRALSQAAKAAKGQGRADAVERLADLVAGLTGRA